VGEGDSAQPWYNAIPEGEARSHIETKGYKNPAELALANYSLTRLQRNDPTVVALPKPDAAPEDMTAFYRSIGAPETEEGYELKFGEEVTVDDGMVKFGKGVFHKAGLRPDQAQIIADGWNEHAASMGADFAEQNAQQNATEIEALRSEWGEKWDQNVAAGRRVVQALELGETEMSKIENAIGSSALLGLMAKLGHKSGESTFKGAGDGGGDPNDPAKMSPEKADARIKELQADVEFQKKYTDRQHPGHAEAVQTMERLYARV
jgi:hypothetical protein